MSSVTLEEKRTKAVNTIMEEFINACDEYLFCLSFSIIGIENKGKDLKKLRLNKGQRLWLGSDLETDRKMHARMDIKELINRCAKNGLFTTELTKALLCMIYSMWDENFRHRISEAYGCEPEQIFCPLMGDLRKIRHCIMHHKSLVSEGGLKFEYLSWQLPTGPLVITSEMFRDINDAIRGQGMHIRAFTLSPELERVLPLMTGKERKSFDDFFKHFQNKMDDNKWPGMQNFLKKNEGKPGIQELTDAVSRQVSLGGHRSN